MAQDFCATVAQASFTLLGLWWVRLQIRYDAWFADVDYRRAVYDISLHFLLPGMMGLGACSPHSSRRSGVASSPCSVRSASSSPCAASACGSYI